MSGWLISRAGSEAQRSSAFDANDADADADADNALALDDPDLQLLPRRLERLKAARGEDEDGDQNNASYLRVLSWNTLADGLAQLGRFSRCPERALAWPRRLQLLLREIGRSGADIACLQEVNRPGDLEPPLRRAGYDGAFWAKPVSPATRLGFPGDGSAVLWKRDRFELVSVVGKPFDAVVVPEPSAAALGASSIAAPAQAATAPATAAATTATPGGGGFGGGGGRRGVQGLLLVTLRDKRDRDRKVVVACVHLKAKEGAANDAARAAQAREAVRALEDEAMKEEEEEEEESGGLSSSPPSTVAILAGDFNAEPGSAPHEAVRGSKLPLRCLWECEREETEGGDGAAATKASSSSSSFIVLPPYTTYKFRSEDSESDYSDGMRAGERKGGKRPSDDNAAPDQLSRRVSDFVFFTPGSAAAVERWAPLDFEREVQDGLPCEMYPSDHAAVLAVLRLK